MAPRFLIRPVNSVITCVKRGASAADIHSKATLVVSIPRFSRMILISAILFMAS